MINYIIDTVTILASNNIGIFLYLILLEYDILVALKKRIHSLIHPPSNIIIIN